MNEVHWQSLGGLLAALWAGWQAYRANKQTKATGNGFAKHVKESLARIEQKVEGVEGKIDRHLEDHTESDLRRRKK